MSLNNKLVTFAQQELVLSHSETERDRINASLSQLETVLKNKLGANIKQFIRFGSFTRNTILPRIYDPNSDVDLMVVFNTANNKYSPGTYRSWILEVIEKSYPNSVSKKDFPVVKLLLNHIMFDIVPAYSQASFFGGTDSYYIPAAGDSWQQTIPNDINQTLIDKNKLYPNNLIRNVIRLCKYWNANADYPKQSYLMEKEILNLYFGYNQDTFESFLSTMNSIAGTRPGVRQALDYIRDYSSINFRNINEAKQLEWLQKLLPALK